MEQARMNDLFLENIPIVYKVYNERILTKNPPEDIREDLLQIGLLALWRACNKYDDTRGAQFSTYAYCSAYKSMICAMARERDKVARLISLSTPINQEEEDPLTFEDDLPCPLDITEGLDILDAIDRTVSEVGRGSDRIIQMLNEGYSQGEIAEEIGITRQAVHRILKTVRAKLKEALK